ncbi:MAG TPA: hypothetical protein VJ998_03675 [Pseudomonadales bacterium]|nr:hypothetical protein [Pseudomonadales bacterium]
MISKSLGVVGNAVFVLSAVFMIAGCASDRAPSQPLCPPYAVVSFGYEFQRCKVDCGMYSIDGIPREMVNPNGTWKSRKEFCDAQNPSSRIRR